MKFTDIFKILQEAIKLTDTEFGNKMPFNNGLFNKANDEIFTFFEHENNVIVVSFDNNDSLNFGVIEGKNANLLHSNSNVKIHKIQELYGKVFYVFSKMVLKYNIDKFIMYSDPSEIKNVKLYNNFANNKYFTKMIKDMGFNEYKKQELDGYDEETLVIHMYNKK